MDTDTEKLSSITKSNNSLLIRLRKQESHSGYSSNVNPFTAVHGGSRNTDTPTHTGQTTVLVAGSIPAMLVILCSKAVVAT